MNSIGEKTFSFVRCVDRDKTANDMEHKIMRKENILRWVKLLKRGVLEIYVDESHWKIGDLCLYNWTRTNS